MTIAYVLAGTCEDGLQQVALRAMPANTREVQLQAGSAGMHLQHLNWLCTLAHGLTVK